ncbi:unnamed protein product [Brassica rapa]|uniref:Uncharacterized protein n=1 Tax=Brassica campestris TaxID=3711 RepID=A0A8D9GX56_BRACM|nr:unnamed protein product [Brassica rapa]
MRYKQIYRKPISNLINYKFAFIKRRKEFIGSLSRVTASTKLEVKPSPIESRRHPYPTPAISTPTLSSLISAPPRQVAIVPVVCELSLSMQRINTLCLHRFDSAWCFYDMSSGLCFAQIRKKMGLFLLMFHLLGLMEKGSSTVCIFKWET